jgi:hypothetical protein
LPALSPPTNEIALIAGSSQMRLTVGADPCTLRRQRGLRQALKAYTLKTPGGRPVSVSEISDTPCRAIRRGISDVTTSRTCFLAQLRNDHGCPRVSLRRLDDECVT